MRLLIYTEQTTERLTYTFDFILGELLGLEYDLTNDSHAFLLYPGAKISYGRKPVEDELFFESVSLLFETDITIQPIDFVYHKNLTGFYPVSAQSVLPFDVFASTFVMISRYEEYLLHKKDKHNRYRSSQSMNYAAGFLSKPMINIYAVELKKLLNSKFTGLKFKANKFEYIATFDVDTAYAYRGKGLKANLRGGARAILMSNFGELADRYKVFFRNKKDPFDTFDYIIDTCRKYVIKTKIFFQVGNRSEFDTNTPHYYEPFQETIRNVAQKSDLGIHLSYGSHGVPYAMEEEIARLEEIIGRKIVANRFHYLRFTMPASYASLNAAGITEDYSFGYTTRVGFRAGTCTPFFLFNVLKNERTNIKIYPFAFMDTTLAQYNKLSAHESLEKILQIMKSVKEVDGPFIGVWHNSSFIESGVWKGWKNVFETVAEEATALTEKSE